MEEVKEEILQKLPFWKRLSVEEKKLVQSRALIREFAKNQMINSNDTTCM